MTLYCVAILIWKCGQWVGDFEYLHAESAGDARIRFTAGNSNDLIKGKMKISGIAPAVGYKQDVQSGIIYA
jgi:hypothetical protein